ncbi:MAG: dihydroxy-acid dehydratase [Chitinophagales bacterium]
MSEINKYSKVITQDPTQPAAQRTMYAIGLNEEDFKKAQVGIVSTGWDGNPCNMHLNGIAANLKNLVNQQNLVALNFYTIGGSDGISMGTSGMLFIGISRSNCRFNRNQCRCLVSYDGIISIAGCDKNMPV